MKPNSAKLGRFFYVGRRRRRLRFVAGVSNRNIRHLESVYSSWHEATRRPCELG